MLNMIKLLAPIAILVITFITGYHKGTVVTETAYRLKLQALQEKNAKDLYALQQDLLDTEKSLLDDTNTVEVRYKTKVKEIVKYVNKASTNKGISLSDCELPDDGLRRVISAYGEETSNSK